MNMRGVLLNTKIILNFGVHCLLLVVMLADVLPTVGQVHLGKPLLQHFEKSVYKAGTQNWDIDQANSGLMYFANNEGLLEFSGSSWRKYPLPKSTICRAVLCNGNRIYAGGQGEMGYFTPGHKGELTYVNLLDSLFKDKLIGDVWQIERMDSTIYFVTYDAIFTFNEQTNEFGLLLEKQGLRYFMFYNRQPYVQIQNEGVFALINNQLKRKTEWDILKSTTVVNLLEFGDASHLVATLNDGFFIIEDDKISPWQTDLQSYLKENSLYHAFTDKELGVFCATSRGGLVQLENNGSATLILDKQSGLLNNNILSLFIDKDKNLWLGLDNGIDFVQLNSPFSFFAADGELEGTSYAAHLHQNTLYVGTNNGLFAKEWASYQKPNKFDFYFEIAGLRGQVWSLGSFEDQLLVSHHLGLFSKKGEQLRQLGNHEGSWGIKPLRSLAGFYIEGTYSGLNIYKAGQNSIEFYAHIKGFNESSRFFEEDNEGNIWIAHPYRGVFKCRLNSSLDSFISVNKYGVAQGFPSDIMFKLFRIRDELYFVAEHGVFLYDKSTDKMRLAPAFTELFGSNTAFRYLAEGIEPYLWYVTDSEVGLLKVLSDGLTTDLQKTVLPQLSEKLVSGFEFIKPLQDDITVVGAERGMIVHSNYKVPPKLTWQTVMINTIKHSGTEDSVLLTRSFGNDPEQPTTWHYTQNQLEFEFTAPLFSYGGKVEYSVKLDGLDKEWSDFKSDNKKEYTNLSPGNYAFRVKARSLHLDETRETTYHFRIAAPWYKTQQAYLAYIVILMWLIFALIFFPRQQYEREKRYLETLQAKKLQQKDIEHRRIVQSTENEMMHLKNEKLQAEITFKNQELASTTMHLVQKTEILTKIKSELTKMSNSDDRKDSLLRQVKRIVKLVDDNVRLDKNWDQFAIHFDQVHVDFNKKMKELYPELSPNDLKLCAYLRMNLSSKEIAPLMNISVRGVEISRYRLRKKLNLDRDVNLYEFLATV